MLEQFTFSGEYLVLHYLIFLIISLEMRLAFFLACFLVSSTYFMVLPNGKWILHMKDLIYCKPMENFHVEEFSQT